MEKSNFSERLDAVERLVEIFKLERKVHLIVTTVSLVMLLTSGALLILRIAEGEKEFAALGLIFGSSGLIAYSANRLLHMWDQAFQVVMKVSNESEVKNV